MIEVDIEEPAISRNMLRSWMSFGVSCITHLILFLLLTIVVYTANSTGVIVLESNSVTDDSDLYNETPMEISLDSEELVFEDTEIEPLDEPLENQITEDQLDWSSVLTEPSEEPADGFDPYATELAIADSGGFFGIEATGNRIVYIIDMSPSMEAGQYQTRFERAVAEVLKSIDQLRDDQEFFVFLFCFEVRPMTFAGKGRFCLPTKSNKTALSKWLNKVRLGPGTDPREALVAALKMKPSCCFLLSDGEFNGRRYGTGKYGGGRGAPTAVALAKKYNRSGCPIHTIGLEDEGSQLDMTQIAEDSNGIYKFIPALPDPDQ